MHGEQERGCFACRDGLALTEGDTDGRQQARLLADPEMLKDEAGNVLVA